MVINRLGYDNASTIGLISKHGFMKLRFVVGRCSAAYLADGKSDNYEIAVNRDRSKPRADAVARPRWWPGAERSTTINGNHEVRTEEEKLPGFGSDSTVEPWQRNP